MVHTKYIIFTLLKVIIFTSQVYSDLNETLGKENAPFGLRKLNNARKRFGPVVMLNNRNANGEAEQQDATEKNTNKKDETLEGPAQIDTDGPSIVNKDPIPIKATEDPNEKEENGIPPRSAKVFQEKNSKEKCWMQVDAKKHFEIMDALDDRFASIRKQFQEAAENSNFSKDMLDMMLKTRGVAQREIHNAAGDPSFIPAGINLGGYGMMGLQNSILFFHRMKLRNNTHFRVKTLQNDLANMVLTTQLSLNDLHILAAYERAIIQNDAADLFYAPTYGELELLLRNVEYNMEGRYRMLRDKLAIELMVSNISLGDILMTYQNNEREKTSMGLERKDIGEFLDKLKTALDKWLKDYFNDYLMYFGFVGAKANEKFIQYNQEKTVALNEYADEVLERIRGRLKELKLRTVRLPQFAVTSIDGMRFKLTQGVLRGLDTIYRRSLATGRKDNKIRNVNAVVGFSSLKATYQYEAEFNTGVPPITGKLVVTADELIAHMGLTLIKDPETLDLMFDSIQQINPESLTLEGPANRIIASFKNLLERHVFTFISNTIIHYIRMLRTITRCEPSLTSDIQNKKQELKSKIATKSSEELNSEAEKPLNSTNDSDRNSDEDAIPETIPDINKDIQKSEESFTEAGQNRNLDLNTNDDAGDEKNAEINLFINENIPEERTDAEDKMPALVKDDDEDPKSNEVDNGNENTPTNTELDTNNDKDNNENE
ncbi:unnamed protein product, partial [Iphiclides podalirius]